MATYTTQAVISVETLETAERPEAVISEAEETVRLALDSAAATPLHAGAPPLVPAGRGDIRIGWLACIPGHTPADRVRVPDRWEEWTPGDELPAGTVSLSCRGRRTV